MRSERFALLALFVAALCTLNFTEAPVPDAANVQPLRDQLRIMQQCLKWRLDNIIPETMRAEGIGMWLILSSGTYSRDPVVLSLFGTNGMSFGVGGAIVFHDRGKELGVERFSTAAGDIYKQAGAGADLYQPLPGDRQKDLLARTAEFIKQRNPKKIGINVSNDIFWSFADGLSASGKERLIAALGPELSSRLVSAEHLCVRWLETRSPLELSIYKHVCAVAHNLIAEYLSTRVIIPDVTTTDEAIWWLKQKYIQLGVGTWFEPYLTIQRYEDGKAKFLMCSGSLTGNETVIRRGDLVHCDVGIVYFGLCTDNQENAYVCRIGESDAPEGLRQALRKANKAQDFFMEEFKEGRSGNEIFLASKARTEKEGLNASIYTHPLGYHGHGAGPVLGLISRQEPIPHAGDYPLHLNTCYSIELDVMHRVPEWGNQEIRMAVEEDAAFTKEGCKFIDGRQTGLFLIK